MSIPISDVSLRRLSSWLESQPGLFHQALREAPELYGAVVRALPRCCELLGVVAAARGHVATACGFVEAGAVEAICQLLRRQRPQAKELQRQGLYCVSCLVHDGGGVSILSGLKLPCAASLSI